MLTPPQFGLAKGINLDLWEMLTGSPDVFDSAGNNVTFNTTPKNGMLYLNLLNCESVCQELTEPLLPGRNYYFLLFTQSKAQSFFSDHIDGCGDFFADSFKDTLLICPGASCAIVDVNTPFDFVWSDGGIGGVREFCETGAYSVNYNIGGCSLREEVWVHQPESLALLSKSYLSVCKGESTIIYVDDNYEVSWDDGMQVNQRTLFKGVYEVSYEAEECLFTEQLLIEETDCAAHPIFIPNAFSPNRDGFNDQWKVFMDDDFFIDVISAELSIYDRWGNFLIQKDISDLTWNGRVNGEDSVEGVYAYVLRYSLKNYQEGFLKKGDITLIR